MSDGVRRTSQFEVDMLEQFLFLTESNVQAAERFMYAVDEALRRLERMPRLGRIRRNAASGVSELRVWVSPDLPRHLIIYEIGIDGIAAMRLIHAARNITDLL